MRMWSGINVLLGLVLHSAVRVFASKDPLTFRGPVLIVTPHPDDETLACGGVIALLAKDHRIVIACMTDGRYGGKSGSNQPQDHVQARMRELRNAAELLGRGSVEVVTLDYEDSSLTRHIGGRLEETLTSLVTSIMPVAIFYPSPHDLNGDHAATGTAARNIYVDATTRRFEYLVWGWRSPLSLLRRFLADRRRMHLGRPVVVDTRQQQTVKARALDCYHSQLASNGPLSWAFLLPFRRPAEVFFAV